jgi:hypothetical protein
VNPLGQDLHKEQAETNRLGGHYSTGSGSDDDALERLAEDRNLALDLAVVEPERSARTASIRKTATLRSSRRRRHGASASRRRS